MKIFLRVTLCITIIAFSISLPQCALGMPLWQHAAICDQCSNPSVAITQIGITWIYQVTLDSFKQNTATRCPKCPPRHAHVHALLTYGDLKPPWIVFVHDCIARGISSQDRPALPNISSLASTSCASLCYTQGGLPSSHHNSRFSTFASWNRIHDDSTPRMLPLNHINSTPDHDPDKH